MYIQKYIHICVIKYMKQYMKIIPIIKNKKESLTNELEKHKK